MDEDTRNRLVRYLDDAWAVEKSLVSNLKTMADEVNDPDVRTLFTNHAEVTHQQEENLEARIRALGEEPSGGKGMFSQLMGKVGDMMHKAHDADDQTTQDLMKAYAAENFEMAMYQSLEAYATAIGDTETAQLARQHQQQEREAADKIWPMISQCAQRPAAMTTGESRSAA